MSVTLGRMGLDEKYKVQFLDDFPDDKIILILDSGRGYAYVVDSYEITGHDENTGRIFYRYHITPIHKLDRTHGFPQDFWFTAEQISEDNDYKVFLLDSLADIKDIENIYIY